MNLHYLPKSITIILSLCIVGTLSCDRVSNKAKRTKDRALEKVEHATKKAEKEAYGYINRAENKLEGYISTGIDNVFPTFNAFEPDTENNKARFTEFLQVPVTSDIKNIYCFDDAIGIDWDYMFAFNCSPATSQKIIEKHLLSPDTIGRDNAFDFQHDFWWWDKEHIATLDKYTWVDNERIFKYFWYDEVTQQAYYFTFSM